LVDIKVDERLKGEGLIFSINLTVRDKIVDAIPMLLG